MPKVSNSDLLAEMQSIAANFKTLENRISVLENNKNNKASQPKADEFNPVYKVDGKDKQIKDKVLKLVKEGKNTFHNVELIVSNDKFDSIWELDKLLIKFGSHAAMQRVQSLMEKALEVKLPQPVKGEIKKWKSHFHFELLDNKKVKLSCFVTPPVES